MPTSRRNAISRLDSQVITGVAVVSGLIAALAGAQPTGTAVPDAVLTFGFAAFITWLGASAPWWALATSAGIVTVASFNSNLAVTLVGCAAAAAALWIGFRTASMAIARSAVAGAIVSVSLRLNVDQFFLASALIAAVALALLATTGWMRRHRYVRKRVLWGVAGFATLMLLGAGGMGVSGLQAKSPATAGYDHLLNGLDKLNATDMAGASQVLAEASGELRDASDHIGSPLTQLARFVPFVAQNRTAADTLLRRAAGAAEAASKALAVVDIDQLRIIDGSIDVDAVAILAGPLGDLRSTVAELSTALGDIDSPWLVSPLQDRLERARTRIDKVDRQAVGASETAQFAPAILGADGTRRYLFAFTNPGEARGVGGVMGNWSEVTITRGKFSVTASGRTSELINGLANGQSVKLDMPADFFARYGQYGAQGPDGKVRPKFWSNVGITADMPSAANAMAQMYEAAEGRHVDGVFIIDIAGIAALLDATGKSIVLPELDQPLTAATIVQFLSIDQYKLASLDRVDTLAEISKQTVQQLLTSSLPAPQDLVRTLSPAALGGHISVWMADPDEESFVRTIGIDNSLPDFASGSASEDGLAVVTNNGSGNKIDTFLHRTIDYRPRYDARTGLVDATLTVTLKNTAPTTGYPDYVIGNIINKPIGTNRTLVEIYTRLSETELTVDGKASTEFLQGSELGWNVYSQFLDIPAGKSVVLVVTLQGVVRRGGYELVYRPQPLPIADTVRVVATDTSGEEQIDFDGTITRRSVLSSTGVAAWRE